MLGSLHSQGEEPRPNFLNPEPPHTPSVGRASPEREVKQLVTWQGRPGPWLGPAEAWDTVNLLRPSKNLSISLLPLKVRNLISEACLHVPFHHFLPILAIVYPL